MPRVNPCAITVCLPCQTLSGLLIGGVIILYLAIFAPELETTRESYLR